MKAPCPSWLGFAFLIAALTASGQPQDEWPISAASEQGLSQEALSKLDEHIRSQLPHLRSLLIARHGHLVFENYYGDASRDALQNIQSMTKSVSSALVGIAVKKGLIASLDARVVDYFPEYQNGIRDDRMKTITVKHLLTMSSGIDEVQLNFDQAYANPVEEILRWRLLYEPGHGFRYSSAGAHLLGGVLRAVSGQSVLDFARAELLGPLGIGQVTWYADKTGLQSGGMSGLWRARDMLKLGELYLRKGNWQGRKIIPPQYVADSVRSHNAGDFLGTRVQYGYMWWIKKIDGHEAFWAAGYGGQYLMVVPDLDMVILCTSDWKQPEYPEHFALVDGFILTAVAAKQ
jgi:CubicO group peptidase (beta-lactamase class C family)